MTKIQHGLLFCAVFLILLNYYIFKENLFPEQKPKMKTRVREIPEVGFQNDALAFELLECDWLGAQSN